MPRIRNKIKTSKHLAIIISFFLIIAILVNYPPTIIAVYIFNVSPDTRTSLEPGHFLSNYVVRNKSFCNFNYGLPDRLIYGEDDIEFSPEKKENSSYKVLYNVMSGRWDLNIEPNLTYVTQITADYANYIPEIVRYWEGPISVAAFVPDFDASILLRKLLKICFCLPGMRRVSVHFVFPEMSPPNIQNNTNLEEISDCNVSDFNEIITYKRQKDLIYPINVCRNVAREMSTTHMVLVSDVELIPSRKLSSNFMKMIRTFRIFRIKIFPSFVFVIPVFEVDALNDLPRVKRDLLNLSRMGKVIYFHKYVCSHCQKFPAIEGWLEKPNRGIVKPYITVKREYPFHRWEPIYIGTKQEPFYSEELSWEGMQDKMTQMLEMCLLQYKFIILDGAFLVHWPGIKKKNNEAWRKPHQLINSKHYKTITQRLFEMYGNFGRCKLK